MGKDTLTISLIFRNTFQYRSASYDSYEQDFSEMNPLAAEILKSGIEILYIALMFLFIFVYPRICLMEIHTLK